MLYASIILAPARGPAVVLIYRFYGSVDDYRKDQLFIMAITTAIEGGLLLSSAMQSISTSETVEEGLDAVWLIVHRGWIYFIIMFYNSQP